MKIVDAPPKVAFVPYYLLIENSTDQLRLVNALSVYQDWLDKNPTSRDELSGVRAITTMIKQRG